MVRPSRSVTEALDRIEAAINPVPDLASGPHEEVYVLQVVGSRRLIGDEVPDADTVWFYHLTGKFTEITGALPGTGTMEEGFSFFPGRLDFEKLTTFPEASKGQPPFDEPPAEAFTAESTETTPVGYSKTQFVFPDGSTIVSLGPSLTKLVTPLRVPGFQLWQTHNGVMSAGTGRFAGAKAQLTSFTSGNLLDLGLNPAKEPFKSGYPVKALVCIRLISKDKLSEG